jgi:hypothetical protein
MILVNFFCDSRGKLHGWSDSLSSKLHTIAPVLGILYQSLVPAEISGYWWGQQDICTSVPDVFNDGRGAEIVELTYGPTMKPARDTRINSLIIENQFSFADFTVETDPCLFPPRCFAASIFHGNGQILRDVVFSNGLTKSLSLNVSIACGRNERFQPQKTRETSLLTTNRIPAHKN